MLTQCWPNVEPTLQTVPSIRTALGHRLVLAGLGYVCAACLHTCLSSVHIGPNHIQQTQDIESSVIFNSINHVSVVFRGIPSIEE